MPVDLVSTMWSTSFGDTMDASHPRDSRAATMSLGAIKIYDCISTQEEINPLVFRSSTDGTWRMHRRENVIADKAGAKASARAGWRHIEEYRVIQRLGAFLCTILFLRLSKERFFSGG
eukprot:scaffold18808_cov85-Cyclotella_meneghiniana.AAC.6